MKQNKIAHLHVNKFNCSPISSWKHCKHFKTSTITEPRGTIFQDLYDLHNTAKSGSNNFLKVNATICIND